MVACINGIKRFTDYRTHGENGVGVSFGEPDSKREAAR